MKERTMYNFNFKNHDTGEELLIKGCCLAFAWNQIPDDECWMLGEEDWGNWFYDVMERDDRKSLMDLFKLVDFPDLSNMKTY